MQRVDGVTLDTEVLDKMIEEAGKKAGQIVETYTLKIASDAAQNAPVDTAALRNSLLSESKMVDETNGIVQDGVEYGIFQELGTHKMAAQPFLIPAVENNVTGFMNAFASLFGFGELPK